MDDILSQNYRQLKQECELGLAGSLSLPVKKIAIALTNRCNLYCSMCHFCSKEYQNRTYNNEPPFIVRINNYQKFFNEDFIEKLLTIGDGAASYDPIEIDFMHGETFLNPDIYYILQHTKFMLPHSYVNVLVNGTIGPDALPHGEECVKYIDLLGFSIDGATQKTYQSIRTPAKFEKVLTNIRKWSNACTKYRRNGILRFCVALVKNNIEELPLLIELAASFDNVKAVSIQPLVVGPSRNFLEPMKLDYVDKTLGRDCILKAMDIAASNGIGFYCSDFIYKLFSVNNRDGIISRPEKSHTRYCLFLRNNGIEIGADGCIREICCNLTPVKNDMLLGRYGLDLKSQDALSQYNSVKYWTMRQDLMDGKWVDICGNCGYGNSDFYHLSTTQYMSHIRSLDEVREDIKFYKKILIKHEQQLYQQNNENLLLKNKLLQHTLEQNRMKNHIADLTAHIEYIEGSFSWRLTSVLRKIRRLFISINNAIRDKQRV